MSERQPSRLDPPAQSGDDLSNHDHWAMFADAMDLTIEGHRLIAEEIIVETKLLACALLNWVRGLPGLALGRGSTPPV